VSGHPPEEGVKEKGTGLEGGERKGREGRGTLPDFYLAYTQGGGYDRMI